MPVRLKPFSENLYGPASADEPIPSRLVVNDLGDTVGLVYIDPFSLNLNVCDIRRERWAAVRLDQLESISICRASGLRGLELEFIRLISTAEESFSRLVSPEDLDRLVQNLDSLGEWD